MITTLDEHPNRREIVRVVGEVPRLDGSVYARLARLWRNTPEVARARELALTPDSPLVIDVLTQFERLALFYDVALNQRFLSKATLGAMEDPMVTLAFKAIRDAIAGAYARPVVPPSGYEALLAPWNACVSPS